MSNTEKITEVEAEVLRLIRSLCEEYFRDNFPTEGQSIKILSEVEKLTGEFLSKKLNATATQCSDVDVDNVKIVVAIGNKVLPVLRAVAASWKIGRFFKKTMKGVFFVWHPDLTDISAAITLGDFQGYLNSCGLDDLSDTVNWIGTAASDIDIKDFRETISDGAPWFKGTICDINYNLKTITFDRANTSLVLKVEGRD